MGLLLFCVGVTGLEPATAWSQTRNATNCATPRMHLKACLSSNAGAKVIVFFETAKRFKNFFHFRYIKTTTNYTNCTNLSCPQQDILMLEIREILAPRCYASVPLGRARVIRGLNTTFVVKSLVHLAHYPVHQSCGQYASQ